MTIIYIISSVPIFLYALMILYFFLYLNRRRYFNTPFVKKVSVIIPFRNEENKLPELLHSLESQKFPSESLEIILVNDHSLDNGPALIKKWMERVPFSVKLIDLNREHGKKAALFEGVNESSHDLLLQTDADCTMDDYWVQYSICPFKDKNVKASLGVVKMVSGGNFWQNLFALEFLSLQASGAALSLMNIPLMANGANLAYRKPVWLKYHEKGEKWASGDDVFFIQQLALADKTAVVFNFKSMTRTHTPETGKEFIQQRVRWGSKTVDYPMPQAQWLAYFVALVNMILLLVLLASVLDVQYVVLLISLYLLKSFSEFLLLYRFASITKQSNLIKWFFISSLLYPLYIFISGAAIVLGTGKAKWKGRLIKNS